MEVLEGRVLLAGDTAAAIAPFQNRFNNLDVDFDSRVTARDALQVISALQSSGPYALSPVATALTASAESSHPLYLDVTGDNQVNARDVLMVVRSLVATKVLDINVSVTDLNGNPITSIDVGQDFLIAVDVQDVRDPVSDTPGVFSAFLDLMYDDGLVNVIQQAPVAGPDFQLAVGQQIDVSTAGVIPGFQAISDASPQPNNNAQRLWTIVAHADVAGTAAFSAAFDAVVSHETLLYPNRLVTIDEIEFTGTTLTILPEPPPVLAIADISLAEGNSGTTDLVFTATLSKAATAEVQVHFATINGSAVAPGDYAAITGTLTFAPGDTSKLITVQVAGDVTSEANETFVVQLTRLTGDLQNNTDEATGTILDDDVAPTVSVSGAAGTEGTNLTFTVTLSAESGQNVLVPFSTAPGTAADGTDFDPTSGTLTFLPGQIQQTVTVAALNDPDLDSNETFQLVLSAPTNATIAPGGGSGVGTIGDEPPPATFSLNSFSQAEGNSGTTSLIFTASLSNPTTILVVAAFATADGTATSPSDYAATSGTLSFLPGETTKLITVQVAGDLTNELPETFTMNLAGLSGPFVGGPATGTATILNDDVPAISIAAANGNEGENLLFTVSLSEASLETVTVAYETVSDSAGAGTDYTSTSGTLTFAPGQTQQVVTVVTLADAVLDPNETFQVALSAPSNATIGLGTATGTIGDIPPSVGFSITNVTQIEGSGVNSSFVFTASLSGATTVAVVAVFSTADGTAVAPGDYLATTGSITFLAGETTKLITVQVIGDLTNEDDETFSLNLAGASGPFTGGPVTGTGTILNDDLPVLSIGNANGNEGSSLLFTVTLSAASDDVVTVPFATVSGSAGAPSDYTPTSGTLTFTAGQTQQVVTVVTLTDAVLEASETFQVELGAPTNATIGPGTGSGTGTIVDVVPTVSLGMQNVSRPEGNSGTPSMVFTATLSSATTQAVVVTFATANGTAVAPGDYAATSGTLTFAPGETAKAIPVQLVGDTVFEADETFTLTLTQVSGPVTGGVVTATGTIVNDDATPLFSVNDVIVQGPRVPPAPPNTKANAVFTVSLSSSVTSPATVVFATANGSATAGQDYDATQGTLTFNPGGLLFQLVTVQVLGQANTAPDETFFLNLTSPSNAGLGDAQGQGTIIRQDSQEIEGTTGNDVFVVFYSPGETNSIIVRQNGVDMYSFDRTTTKSLSIKGLAGDDTLIVDSTNGLVALEDGIFFDGGTGRDSVRLEQSDATSYAHSRYTVGPNPGEGVSETEFQPVEGLSTIQRVTFDNIEPFFDFLPAADLTVTATDGDNAINYASGTLPLTGLVTVDNQESIEFANKTTLIIEALNGSDTINLNNSVVPLGLTSIEIDAADPTGSDTLIVNTINATLIDPTPVPDVLTVTPIDQGAGEVVSSGAANLVTQFVGVEHLKLVGRMSEGDSFSIEGTRTDDRFFYSVGATPDTGSVAGVMNSNPNDPTPGPFPLVPITFSGMATAPGVFRQFNVNNSGGFDSLTYTSTGASSEIAVAQGAATLTISESLQLTGYGIVVGNFLGRLKVDGAAGNDNISYVVQTAGNEAIVQLEGSDSDNTSDTLTFGALPNDATTVDLQDKSVQSTSSAEVFFGGFEKVVLVSNGNTSTLTVEGTLDDDEVTYTPTGALAGKFALAGLNVAFSFTGVAGAFTVGGGDGNAADLLNVRGTAGRDTFRIDATNAVRTVAVNQLKPVTLATTIEILTALGLAGDDTFLVVPDAGIAAGDVDDGDLAPFLDNLLINIDGGDPQASDALVIASDLTGAILDDDQFVVVRRSATPGAGTVRVYEGAAAFPDISYSNVEIVSPQVAGTGFSPNLLILGPDLYEPNDFLGTASFLGSGSNLQIQHAAIFPDSNEHFAVPADQDFYRVVASQTGTLDFQVYFRPFDVNLLPGGGLLGIEILDSAGNVIGRAGAGAVPLFGAANSALGDVPDTGARVRIPAVAGQSYFLRVFGQLIAGTPNSNVVNGYDATIINTPAPVPFSLALSRRVDPPAVGDPGTGDLPTDAPTSDTGRSQFDNVTQDNTPTIFIRLADGILLNDLPGNGTPGNAPIGSIEIPFVGDADPDDPGFRIAIFDGNNSQTPIGFATAVIGFPGLYTFTFTEPLSEGLHHINAAVQIVDPHTGTPITGFGALSVHSLDLIIDTVDPLVFFGTAAAAFDGLAAGSDSGVPNTPTTYVDRVTSDTTPTFHGVAEANSIIKVFVRLIGPAGPVDILLGQTVAIPTDGTNAYPGGTWTLTSLLDLNALPNPADPGQLFPRDGVRQIVVTAEDLAGNVSDPQLLDIFIDTQGPTIAGVEITGDPFDLFGAKTVNPPPHTPTPLINSLTIYVEDLPLEDANFLRNAIAEGVVDVPGLITLRGDHNGVIPIVSITIIPTNPQVVGEPARDTIVIEFASPLPDDRYTLFVSDELVDPAGNSMDGENTAAQPQPPNFNTGNGVNSGDFIARFTVDSRPEIGVYAGKSVLADINGNGYFDPAAPDMTNRDLPFLFGEVSDQRFAGKLSPDRLPGFDVLAAYGNINGQWRFLIDFNGNGAVDFDENLPAPANLQINGMAVAGNFDGDETNGDEIALFTGSTFYIFNNARTAASTVNTSLRGYALAGDFDGDNIEDLATYQGDVFSFDFGNDGFGSVQATINFGSPGVLDRPLAADMDGDGIDDIGIWIPRSGTDQNTAEWRFLISNDPLGRNRTTGQVSTLNHPFSPTPLGADIGFHFGDPTSLPLVGNFDPPVNAATAKPQSNNGASSPSTPSSQAPAATPAAPTASVTQARAVVASLYHDILGRAPDAGGWDLFTQQIVSGTSREVVANSLLSSREYYGHVVDTLYVTYLHRQADAAGRVTWVNQLAAGASENSVAASLLLSVEYAQMHANDAAFLEALYHDILGRAADAAGRSTFLFALGTGSARSEVVTALLTSQERAARSVDQAYQDMFDRHADAAGLALWSAKLRSGQLSASGLRASLAATDEYFAKATD